MWTRFALLDPHLSSGVWRHFIQRHQLAGWGRVVAELSLQLHNSQKPSESRKQPAGQTLGLKPHSFSSRLMNLEIFTHCGVDISRRSTLVVSWCWTTLRGSETPCRTLSRYWARSLLCATWARSKRNSNTMTNKFTKCNAKSWSRYSICWRLWG